MRVVNIHKERFTRYIGRGSRFGNPFTHSRKPTTARVKVETKQDAVDAYRSWLLCLAPYQDFEPEMRSQTLKAIKKLDEYEVLGCHCLNPPCHGYVVIELWYALNKKERWK